MTSAPQTKTDTFGFHKTLPQTLQQGSLVNQQIFSEHICALRTVLGCSGGLCRPVPKSSQWGWEDQADTCGKWQEGEGGDRGLGSRGEDHLAQIRDLGGGATVYPETWRVSGSLSGAKERRGQSRVEAAGTGRKWVNWPQAFLLRTVGSATSSYTREGFMALTF